MQCKITTTTDILFFIDFHCKIKENLIEIWINIVFKILIVYHTNIK